MSRSGLEVLDGPVSHGSFNLSRKGDEGGVDPAGTDRGRPVAVLAPIPDRGSLDELRATGQLDPARADFSGLPDPLPIPTDGPSASDLLTALRRDER